MKARFRTYGFNISGLMGAPAPNRFDIMDDAMKDTRMRMSGFEYFYVAAKIDGDFKKIAGFKNGKRLHDRML